jgi:hypothetical protein
MNAGRAERASQMCKVCRYVHLGISTIFTSDFLAQLGTAFPLPLSYRTGTLDTSKDLITW